MTNVAPQYQEYLKDDGTTIKNLLQDTDTIAVIGISDEPTRPSHSISAYLAQQGFNVLGVNPEHQAVLNRPVWNRVDEIDQPVDIVLIFRRKEAVKDHLDQILAMDPPPKAVWMQTGIRDDDVAAALAERKIHVIQDRCIKVQHGQLIRKPVQVEKKR